MKISNAFKNAIAKTFYDKTAYFCDTSTEENARGQVIEKPEVREANSLGDNSFACNIQFPSKKKILEDYGFSDNVEMTLTCDSEIALSEGDFINYLDTFYKILEMKVRDSHKLIGARKWLSKSLTLPSV